RLRSPHTYRARAGEQDVGSLTPHAAMAAADPLPTAVARRRTLNASGPLRWSMPSVVDDPVRLTGVFHRLGYRAGQAHQDAGEQGAAEASSTVWHKTPPLPLRIYPLTAASHSLPSMVPYAVRASLQRDWAEYGRRWPSSHNIAVTVRYDF